MKYGHVDYNKCVEMNMYFDVYVNGEKIEDAFEADDVEGYVKYHVKDNSGQFVLNGDDLEFDTLLGSVELVPL